MSRRLWTGAAVGLALIALVPVAVLAVSILRPNTAVWRQQWETRLPGQLVTTAGLLAGVVTGAVALGVGLAWLVSAHRFPGRGVLAWLLVLPLAMPGYIHGFVTLSVFGYTGPVQAWWRDRFGDGAWFPQVRSLGGAVVVLSLVLYPYVYLLARAALRDQAGAAYDTARTLGAGPVEAARRVVLPLLRPAIAAGAAVVAMETLTDLGTVQYLGVDTVTVGVFRIWRGTYDRDAAAELATLVLVVAVLLIGFERVLRGRARYATAGSGAGVAPRRLRGVRGWGATAACSAVVLAGFGAPVARLATWAIAEQRGGRGTPAMERQGEYLTNSVVLALWTVGLCLVVSVVLANAQRFGHPRLTRLSARAALVGYAVPGAVVGMGVLLVSVGVDDLAGRVGLELPGLVATGSFTVLVAAYAVRFLAPGLTAVEAGLEAVPEEMTAAARSLGAPPRRVLARVHLPVSRASLLGAALLVGVDALKELPIVLLLRPFGFDTLPVWVYQLAAESRFQQAALPALTIVAVAMVPVAVLSRRLDAPGVPA